MSQFSLLFADYSRITDEIRAAVSQRDRPEGSDNRIDPEEVVAQILRKYRDDLSLTPSELMAAVVSVATEAGVALGPESGQRAEDMRLPTNPSVC